MASARENRIRKENIISFQPISSLIAKINLKCHTRKLYLIKKILSIDQQQIIETFISCFVVSYFNQHIAEH